MPFRFIRAWRVPEGGLVAQTNEPEFVFSAHSEKVQIVKFHPIAQDILLTSSFDRSIKVWNLLSHEEPKLELQVSLNIPI